MYKIFSYWSKIEFSKFVNKFIRYQIIICNLLNSQFNFLEEIINDFLQNKVGELNFYKIIN